MRDATTRGGPMTGPELYNEVRRLICEWRGNDAAEESEQIKQLVDKIVRLARIDARQMAALAIHDNAEAA